MIYYAELRYRDYDKERQQVIDLPMQCFTQEQVAEIIGIDQATISRVTTELMQNGHPYTLPAAYFAPKKVFNSPQNFVRAFLRKANSGKFFCC